MHRVRRFTIKEMNLVNPAMGLLASKADAENLLRRVATIAELSVQAAKAAHRNGSLLKIEFVPVPKKSRVVGFTVAFNVAVVVRTQLAPEFWLGKGSLNGNRISDQSTCQRASYFVSQGGDLPALNPNYSNHAVNYCG